MHETFPGIVCSSWNEYKENKNVLPDIVKEILILGEKKSLKLIWQHSDTGGSSKHLVIGKNTEIMYS